MLRKILSSLLFLASPAFAKSHPMGRAECLVPVVLPPGGQRAEVQLPVDRCDALRVVTAFATDKAKVQFIRPDGAVIPWVSGSTDLEFDMSEQPGEGESDPVSYAFQAEVDHPMAGTWKVALEWPEAQWAGDGTVVYALFQGSPVKLAVLVPGSAIPLGSGVVATLALMEGGKPRFQGEVTGILGRDGVSLGPVTFARRDFPDQGAQALLADLPVQGVGHYSLDVICTGPSEGGAFKRTASVDFEVFEPKGKFLGTVASSLK